MYSVFRTNVSVFFFFGMVETAIEGVDVRMKESVRYEMKTTSGENKDDSRIRTKKTAYKNNSNK